jgi:sec-independent protein translocase protein TatB
LFDIGFGELLVLGVLALFVFGPERLPRVAAEAARALRDVRTMAQNARQQLTDTIDPELRSIDVKGLDPREFVRRTVLEDPAPASPTTPRVPGQKAARDGAGKPSATEAGSATPAANPAVWDADTT